MCETEEDARAYLNFLHLKCAAQPRVLLSVFTIAPTSSRTAFFSDANETSDDYIVSTPEYKRVLSSSERLHTMAEFIGQGYLTSCPVNIRLTSSLQLTDLSDLEEGHSVWARGSRWFRPGSPVANDLPAMLAHSTKSVRRIPQSPSNMSCLLALKGVALMMKSHLRIISTNTLCFGVAMSRT